MISRKFCIPAVARPLHIGQRVRFDPLRALGRMDPKEADLTVTGTVIYIHRAHGWFLLRYGPGLRMGFRFDDIGVGVTLCD